MHKDIPYRDLGRTGERVSAIGIGGWHLALARVDRALAIRIVRTALDGGINFLDNCWDYNDGASEVRMGKALRVGFAIAHEKLAPGVEADRDGLFFLRERFGSGIG